MTILADYLEGKAPRGLASILTAVANTSLSVRRMLPFSMGLSGGVNPSGERQTAIDVYANDTLVSSLLATGFVAEVASEELDEPVGGPGDYHVSMDPLDGSSNISTNNPLGSIFGIYSSALPCSGAKMVGAGFVTYGPMLTITFSTGDGVHRFVAVERERKTEFVLLDESLRIPEEAEVYGVGGPRREWVEPVERFVTALEGRGMKVRYGGTFVGDFNQVLRYGGIFAYPALKKRPRGKLRVLYEVAPMGYIAAQAGGYASDGKGDVLSIEPKELAETTPAYLGSASLVRELEDLMSGRR